MIAPLRNIIPIDYIPGIQLGAYDQRREKDGILPPRSIVYYQRRLAKGYIRHFLMQLQHYLEQAKMGLRAAILSPCLLSQLDVRFADEV